MCFKCGNMDHFDNSLIVKAVNDAKLSVKEKPKFKLQSKFEDNFKQDYKEVVKNSIKEILFITDKQIKEKLK